jgi:polyhydroxybutyrate depolymerase
VKFIRPILAVWLLCIAINAGAQTLPPGTHELALTHDGARRVYLAHVPAETRGPVPLVLMLHGGGGDAWSVMRQTRWDRLAEREGFVVAFGQALPVNPRARPNLMINPNVWDDGSLRGSRRRGPVDDIGYVAAVIDDLSRRTAIDPRRVYLTGHSNGAAMTFHAGAALASRLAAVAPVQGNWFSPRERIAPPLPLLLIAGERDPLTPLAGGPTRMPWGTSIDKPPVIQSAREWANAIGCRGEALSTRDQPPSLIRWPQCPAGAEVVMRTIRGHGHEWPGGNSRLPERIMGPRVTGIDATALIWEFFGRFTRH